MNGACFVLLLCMFSFDQPFVLLLLYEECQFFSSFFNVFFILCVCLFLCVYVCVCDCVCVSVAICVPYAAQLYVLLLKSTFCYCVQPPYNTPFYYLIAGQTVPEIYFQINSNGGVSLRTSVLQDSRTAYTVGIMWSEWGPYAFAGWEKSLWWGAKTST